MSVATGTLFELESSFAAQLEGLYVPWKGAEAPEPRLLALNEPLARELGADPDALRSDEAVAVLAGSVAPAGSTPIAQAYSGHQFGGFAPVLGDGRALLVGELIDVGGNRRDLHLKGSGRTPFARGGDGKAVVGPMLREYVIGEAMHALGVPTSRALAVVATGEQVIRETLQPGAVLARVAASHIRVGTFQYAAIHKDETLLRRLADYAIARHYPHLAEADSPYLTFLEAVVEAQAELIARWIAVGFIHGVMNTDNMAISGESIDYGPCAFIDAYDPATVFSSIDHGGRYAYGNQPRVAQWNLARLAEPLLPLLNADTEAAIATATGLLETFPSRYERYWLREMRAKLGLAGEQTADKELIDDLLEILHGEQADFTASFRALAASLRGEEEGVRELFADRSRFDAWQARWRERLGGEGTDLAARAAAMDRVNPIYIPRNHLVEEALKAATAGELGSFERLVEAVTDPFDERPGLEEYTSPAPDDFGTHITYCGT